MATKIFTPTYMDTQTWTAQGALLQWGIVNTTPKDIPLILSRIQVQYEQKIESIYPVAQHSSNKLRINIKGAPSGILTTYSIFAPGGVANLKDFIEAVSKDCKPSDQQVDVFLSPFGSVDCQRIYGANARPGASVNRDFKFTLHGVELTRLDFDLQGSEAAMVNLPLQFRFTSLEWEISNSPW